MIKKLLKKFYFSRKNKSRAELEPLIAKPFANQVPQKVERIVFVVPHFSAFSGGNTSILRLGTYLSKRGYQVKYAVFDQFDKKAQNAAAQSCLADYLGEIVSLNEVKNSTFDAIIATNWISAYYAQDVEGYKFIFAQDFEPFFYAAGDEFLLARKSYELGFHIVSLGAWNKEAIHRYIKDSLQVDVIPFPYERSEYPYKNRNFLKYKEKTIFSLCVYIRETPRRLPGLCQLICKHLVESFKKDGLKLNVYYYGETLVKYKYGKNLGKLNKTQLAKLYATSDFGMVASYTNISLVPYEMMATGLPLIEMKDGSFPFFFGEDDAFLFDADYDRLYTEIKNAIDNPEILVERDKRVCEKLSGLSWEKTAAEFEAIMQSVLRN